MPDIAQITRNEDGSYPACVWPGGYSIEYVCADGGVLCSDCANGRNGSEASSEADAPSDWRIVGYDVIEGQSEEEICCDHCGAVISAAQEDDE